MSLANPKRGLGEGGGKKDAAGEVSCAGEGQRWEFGGGAQFPEATTCHCFHGEICNGWRWRSRSDHESASHRFPAASAQTVLQPSAVCARLLLIVEQLQFKRPLKEAERAKIRRIKAAGKTPFVVEYINTGGRFL